MAQKERIKLHTQTSIVASVKKLKAKGNFHCACCQREKKTEPVINLGDDFFWITGERTYECVKTNWEQRRKVNDMVPYIPRGIYRTPRYENVKAKDFKDPILTHKVCKECFFKFSKFVLLYAESVAEYEIVYSLEKYTFSFTTPCSMKDYICQTCNTDIVAGMTYVRKGMTVKFCLDCIKPIKSLIGNEYSYG
jgi:hypothetical protein